MITLYTTVRGFTGEYDHIQRNAIGSWLQLEPAPEVILFGDDEPGAQGFAAEVGLPIYPLIRGWKGIPLVISQTESLSFTRGTALATVYSEMSMP